MVISGTLTRRRWMTRLAHCVGSDGPKDLSVQEQLVLSALTERAKVWGDEPSAYELVVLDRLWKRWVDEQLRK